MPVTFKTTEPFYHNFDLSVVIPFYRKMREFRSVFPKNSKYLERNGIEVVIVLDTPEESKELMISFFGGEPFLCYKRVMLPILTYAKKIAQENNVRFVSNCTTNGSLINIERIKELKS